MTKIHLILMLIFPLFLSCGNRNTSVNKNNEKNIQEEENICLLDNSILNTVKELRIENPDLTEFYVAISFTDNINSEVIEADSAIFISFYDEKSNFDVNDYKGILSIENETVLIFDRNNVGLNYYNTSKLKDFPLEEIIKTELDLVVIDVFKIKNGNLIQWVGP